MRNLPAIAGLWRTAGRARRTTIQLAIVLALAASLLRPAPAYAAGCDPHAADQIGSWHAFALRSAALIDAVRAQLLGYRPFVPFSFTAQNAALAYVMLQTAGGKWAQVGWYEYDLGYRKTFVQWIDANGNPQTREYDPPADGQYQEYAVSYTGAAGQKKFNFYKGRTVQPLISVSAAFDPDKGEVASEITNTLAQMPGNFGALSFMKFIAMEKRITGTWSAYSPDNVGTSDNTKWYASNARGGMDPLRELVTADRRGDCA